MSLQTFYIFRHGETDWNKTDRLQGHSDIPLNPLGHEQAQTLVPAFANIKIAAVVSSDLIRAQETALKVTTAYQLPVHTDPRLRESFLGQLEGLTYQEVENRFGTEMLNRWRSPAPEHLDFGFPGGETKKQVRDRALEALLDWGSKFKGDPIGVSSHGGLIRMLLTHANPHFKNRIFVRNCSLYKLELDLINGRWFAELENLNRATRFED